MSAADLQAHLATGNTKVCQAWAISRLDGTTLGFTDHDRSLRFDGITFVAESGMSAKALASSTGLSVNNTEAVGLIQSAAIREADITAGRYDDATVKIWQVRWDDVAARQLKFVGTIGEITQKSGTFQAELRGLTESLNQPQGRSYLRKCSAVLGDAACGVDLNNAAFTATALVVARDGANALVVDVIGYDSDWFDEGTLRIDSGAAAGLTVAVRAGRVASAGLRVACWSALPDGVMLGDAVRLTTGCDKRAETCRAKFANMLNFQGFPDIPGDDWLVSVPRSNDPNTGGSLTQ